MNQPNPFEPSPAPPNRAPSWALPTLITVAGLVVGAIANAQDSTPLRFAAGALIVIAILSFSLSRLGSGLRLGTAKFTLKIPPGAIPPGSTLERSVEEKLQDQLEQAGVHLTDQQLREAVEKGSVVSASSSVVIGGKVGQVGTNLTINGKTIDPTAILATGTDATATIEGVMTAPHAAEIPSGTKGLEILTLRVTQPGTEERKLTIPTIVPDDRRHFLYPGAALPVRVSRDDPDLVAVDWQRVT